MAGEVWTQRGGDSGHTSYVDIELDPTDFGEIWSQPLTYPQIVYGGSIQQAVASDGERVYRTKYGTANAYHLIAFDLESGEEVWRQSIPTQYGSSSVGEPVVAGGIVYVNREGHSSSSGTTDAGLPRLFGFDAATGGLRIQNNYSAQWGSEERPAVDGDQLVVEDGYYGGISSYQASTLARQWNHRGSQSDLPLAAFSDNYIYAYGNQVFHRTTGAILPSLTHPWQSAKFLNAMVSSNNNVLVDVSSKVSGNNQYGLASYADETRALQWTTSTLAPIGTKAVGNGLVVATSGHDVLILDESSGSLLRTWQSPKTLTAEIVLTRDHVFVQSYDSGNAKVHAIDLATGQEVWSYEYRQSSYSAVMEMALVGDTMLLSHGNFVRALSPDWTSNSAPVASDIQVVTGEETKVYGVLSAVDADGQALTYSFVGQGSGIHSSAFNRSTGAFEFTPPRDFYGEIVLTYQATDSSGAVSNPANVTIIVRPANDPPTAQNLSLSTSEDTGVSGRLLAYDIDSALSFHIVTPPANGSLASFDPASGQFHYVPKANFAGVDTFRFRVKDGEFSSTVALVTISVSPVNDAPVAIDSNLTVSQDTDLSARLKAIDVESAALTYEVLDYPQHGFLTEFNPQTGVFVYTPRAGYLGTDTFTFRTHDGLAQSNTATILLRVDVGNQPPVALSQTLAALEDTRLTGRMIATDDSEGVQFTLSSLPQHGSLISFDSTTGLFTYKPKGNYAGPDSFSFQANDGRFISNLATIELNVAPVDDRPQTFSRHIMLDQNQQARGFLPRVDVDGDALTYSQFQAPWHGTLTLDSTTGQFVYTPPADFVGFDVVMVLVTDGKSDSRLARICFSVHPVNSLPAADGSVTPLVSMDVAPGDATNTVNLSEPAIRLAILATETFKPHTMLDLTNLQLKARGSIIAAAATLPDDRFDLVDVNDDSWEDLVLEFTTADAGLSLDDTWLILTGNLKAEFGGHEFSVEQQVTLRSK
jgi:outer membrane protein assembly factor BamB